MRSERFSSTRCPARREFGSLPGRPIPDPRPEKMTLPIYWQEFVASAGLAGSRTSIPEEKDVSGVGAAMANSLANRAARSHRRRRRGAAPRPAHLLPWAVFVPLYRVAPALPSRGPRRSHRAARPRRRRRHGCDPQRHEQRLLAPPFSVQSDAIAEIVKRLGAAVDAAIGATVASL